MEPFPYLWDFTRNAACPILYLSMTQRNSLVAVSQERLPAGEPAVLHVPGQSRTQETLAIRERAERLYRMGELAAAAQLLIMERAQ